MSNGVVTAKTSSYTLTYNAATGEITAEEGAGGSGGGGGSSTEPRVIWLDRVEDNNEFLPAGLTWEDFVGSYICDYEKPAEEMPATTFYADMVLSIAIPAYSSDPETLEIELSHPTEGRARYHYAPADGLFWKDDN